MLLCLDDQITTDKSLAVKSWDIGQSHCDLPFAAPFVRPCPWFRALTGSTKDPSFAVKIISRDIACDTRSIGQRYLTPTLSEIGYASTADQCGALRQTEARHKNRAPGRRGVSEDLLHLHSGQSLVCLKRCLWWGCILRQVKQREGQADRWSSWSWLLICLTCLTEFPRAAKPHANRVTVADASMPLDIISRVSPSLSCTDTEAYDFFRLKAAEDISPGYAATGASGRLRVKVLPLPSVLSTSIWPPCSSTSLFDIANPIPSPPSRRWPDGET